MHLVEIRLNSFLYCFRRLTWTEEAKIKVAKGEDARVIILAHALHDISGLPVTSLEDALKVIRAIPGILRLPDNTKDFQSAIPPKAAPPWVLAHMDVVTRTAPQASAPWICSLIQIECVPRFHRHPCRRYISEPLFYSPGAGSETASIDHLSFFVERAVMAPDRQGQCRSSSQPWPVCADGSHQGFGESDGV